MRLLELLAPAKNAECAIAAIDHGADAVYIGAGRYGARAQAGNDIGDIASVCRYAHKFGAKVYVTVNTIIYDDELKDTQGLISQLHEIGVDAILVQDMGLVTLPLPDIALHASTQTDNRSAEKVRWLYSLGFKRVVLARELSASEIAAIHKEVPDVELEVFVHGALCVSYSGQCYISEHCFHRSANRGACAQVCRMPFDLVDASGKVFERQRHLLSLKDLCQIDHMQELIDAGACSFKIEGRLKDVSYIKNVVAAYSQSLNAIIAAHPGRYCRSSRGMVKYSFTPDLQKTFNRGFTNYFLHGRQKDIFSPDTPKAIGEFVGTVKEVRSDSFTIASVKSFANGDGLCFISGYELNGFRINKAVGNRLYPHVMPRQLQRGISLYRNYDQEFERQLSKTTAQRVIPVVLTLGMTSDGYSLTDGVSLVTAVCEHQQAQKPSRDNIISQLSRLGGTAYEATAVNIPQDFQYFIPNSILSELRRKLVVAMDSAGNGESSELRENTQGHALQENIKRVSLPEDCSQQYPAAYTYLYNVSNQRAADFYGFQRANAYEIAGGNGPLMQCRHCLRYSLGYCSKVTSAKVPWQSPLMLRLSDGRQFRLEFDCKKCQMNVYAF